MSEDELSILRERVERLEKVLQRAAGDWDDLGGRIDSLLPFDDCELRLRELKSELEEGVIWDMERDVQELKSKLSEISDRLIAEAQAIRGEATDLSDSYEYRFSEILDELEATKRSVEEQADEIFQLTERLGEETARRVSQEEELRNELEITTRGLASEEEVASRFQLQQRRYECQERDYKGRIDSLQRQLNAADAELTRLKHAVAQPAFADRLLGCILALALLAGFIWLAIKLLYWVVGLIRGF